MNILIKDKETGMRVKTIPFTGCSKERLKRIVNDLNYNRQFGKWFTAEVEGGEDLSSSQED